MTWLALADPEDRRFCVQGLELDGQTAPQFVDDPRTMLLRGSIMFETRLTPDTCPKVLLGYRTTYPVLRSLTFQTVPGGGIAMVQAQGKCTTHAAVECRDTQGAVRVTYSWDSRAKWGRLALDIPGGAAATSVPVANPRALTMDDVSDLMLGRGEHVFDPDMIFAALSDRIEPIGPMPTLLPHTAIATPQGDRPVGDLKRGDTVLTRDAGIVPVLHVVQRTVPARGSFGSIRLCAPHLGLRQDIVAASRQRLILSGPEAAARADRDRAAVPVGILVDGVAASAEPCGPTITYTQVLLPECENLLAAGAELESLHIGDLRRRTQDLNSSLLQGLDRSTLPDHAPAPDAASRSGGATPLTPQCAA